DVCLQGAAIDLTKAGGLLHLAERSARDLVWTARRASAKARLPYVVGNGCEVHPSARIHGHVVLQDGVKIQAGATVIGPALIGHHSVIGPDASIAQCLVMPGTRVRGGAKRSCAVVQADQSVEDCGAEATSVPLHDPANAGKAAQRASTYTSWKAVVDAG